MTAPSDSLPRHPRAFLSSNQDDRVLAEQARKVLNREAQAKGFSADAVRAGENRAERLKRELKAADVFVLIGTPRTQTSASVLTDLGMAWGLRKPPVIVVTNRADRTIRLPVERQSLRQVSLDEFERDGASQLLTQLTAQAR